MSNKTKIEWTQEVWNPIAGCSIKSAGCDNCYAMTMAYRLEAMGQHKYQGTTRKNASGRTLWTGKVNFDGKALLKPLSWKKPRRIFVNSMFDLFHENVKDEWIDHIFAVMTFCPQHTFQILTKRPERMQQYLLQRKGMALLTSINFDNPINYNIPWEWPLKNVWLGVSVEDQETANERIPLLLDTPAAVRWISAEPLLGEIDLIRLLAGEGEIDALNMHTWEDEVKLWDNTSESWEADFEDHFGHWPGDKSGPMYQPIDWVVVGGESGTNARPMHPDWVRSLRDQFKAAGVPFFFKQWGEWAPRDAWDTGGDDYWIFDKEGTPTGCRYQAFMMDEEDGAIFRVGKKKAGHLLDGKVIQQYPGDV